MSRPRRLHHSYRGRRVGLWPRPVMSPGGPLPRPVVLPLATSNSSKVSPCSAHAGLVADSSMGRPRRVQYVQYAPKQRQHLSVCTAAEHRSHHSVAICSAAARGSSPPPGDKNGAELFKHKRRPLGMRQEQGPLRDPGESARPGRISSLSAELFSAQPGAVQLRVPLRVARTGVIPGPYPMPRWFWLPPTPGRSSSPSGIGEVWKCHIFQTGLPSPSSRW